MARLILVAEDIDNESESKRSRAERVKKAAAFLGTRSSSSVRTLLVEPPYRRWLKQSSKEVRREKGDQLFVEGDPFQEILKASRRLKPWILVLGTQGRSQIGQLILGSVSEEVIRHSKIPVMVCGPSMRNTYLYGHEILCAIDFSKPSLKALKFADDLAVKTGLSLRIVHSVYGDLHPLLQTAQVGLNARKEMDEFFKDELRRAQKLIEKLKKKLRTKSIQVELDTSKVSASESLLSKVRTDTSIVVVGTRGQNRLLTTMMGSVSREVILKSRSPVIAVS